MVILFFAFIWNMVIGSIYNLWAYIFYSEAREEFKSLANQSILCKTLIIVRVFILNHWIHFFDFLIDLVYVDDDDGDDDTSYKGQLN